MFLYQESQFLELAILIKAYLGHCLDLFFTKYNISLGERPLDFFEKG